VYVYDELCMESSMDWQCIVTCSELRLCHCVITNNF